MNCLITHLTFNYIDTREKRYVNSLIKNNYKVSYIKRNKENERFIHFTIRAIKLLKKSKPCVIHAHRMSGVIPAVIYKILYNKKVKIIYDKHDTYKFEKIFDKITKKYIDVIITVSKEQLKPFKNFKKKLIIQNTTDFKPISNKIKERIRKKLKLNKNDIFVLYQGSIVKLYGIEDAVEVFQELPNNIKLIIIGWIRDKKLWDKIKNKIKRNIFYVGPIDYKEMNKYVGSADIGLILYKNTSMVNAGNPNKLFEYIACKVPIISTNIKSVKPFIKKLKCGIIVNNNKELKEAILKLSNPRIRKKYIIKRKSPFTWEEEFKKYAKVLENLI